MRILFASSELYPLIKTGGLADVSFSLPQALQDLGHELRIVLPFYHSVKNKAQDAKCLFRGKVFGLDGELSVFEYVIQGRTPLKVWLVDAPGLLDREGGPYTDAYNQPWSDSAYIFATFSRVVAMLALDQCELEWKPDVLHCNDWQTGLAIPLVQREQAPPATVFTIHNLAYQGNFTRAEFDALHLPEMPLPKTWWSMEGIEFYGKCSFLKAGALHADYVTTVSPNYAKEVTQAQLGEGFDGILRHRGERFVGILNGVDAATWNPQTDSLIAANFSVSDMSGKAVNKQTLQKRLGLAERNDVPLFGMVCRMVWQKGVNLLIDAMPELAKRRLQMVLLGSGDNDYETALHTLQTMYPNVLVVKSGYDETLAHQIEASADFFLMPSRYEPCGLNQIYSLKYGTLPIVRATGGLVDTVVDVTKDSLNSGTATGFIFDVAAPEALIEVVDRALDCFQDKALMARLQRQAMTRNFDWAASSRRYEALYQSCCSAHAVSPSLASAPPADRPIPVVTPTKGKHKRGSYESPKEIPEKQTGLQSYL